MVMRSLIWFIHELVWYRNLLQTRHGVFKYAPASSALTVLVLTALFMLLVASVRPIR